MRNNLLRLFILLPIVFTLACPDKDDDEDTDIDTGPAHLFSESVPDPAVSESECTYTWEDVGVVPSDIERVQVDSVKFLFAGTEFEVAWGGAAPQAEVLAPGADEPDTFTVKVWAGGDTSFSRVETPYILIPSGEVEWTGEAWEEVEAPAYIGSLTSPEPPNGTWTLTMLSLCDQVNADGLTLNIYGYYE